jgi:hypothetical protein
MPPKSPRLLGYILKKGGVRYLLRLKRCFKQTGESCINKGEGFKYEFK